jgi:hypothetical protein
MIPSFPPAFWAAAPSDCPRTMNAVESFNSHYNGLFYHSTPHIHLVVDALLGVQVSTDLTLTFIRRGRINPRANENESRREVLKVAYAKYTFGEYTRLRYVKKVNFLLKSDMRIFCISSYLISSHCVNKVIIFYFCNFCN